MAAEDTDRTADAFGDGTILHIQLGEDGWEVQSIVAELGDETCPHWPAEAVYDIETRLNGSPAPGGPVHLKPAEAELRHAAVRAQCCGLHHH